MRICEQTVFRLSGVKQKPGERKRSDALLLITIQYMYIQYRKEDTAIHASWRYVRSVQTVCTMCTTVHNDNISRRISVKATDAFRLPSNANNLLCEMKKQLYSVDDSPLHNAKLQNAYK